MSCSHKLYVIFPAAGSGSRMHSDKNKLLMEVDGITVIDRTIAAFKKYADEFDIDLSCVLVVSPGKIDEWKSYVSDKEYSSIINNIVEGGDTRTKSVGNGVAALKAFAPAKDDAVFIHDAARCLIDTMSIARCFDAINEDETKVCVSGVKTKNTIKMVKADSTESVIVESTPNRDLLYEVQTPQCFKYSVLEECYKRASGDGYEATDDTALAEHYGFDVRIVEGSYANIKITTPEDIAIAESLL
jgi:2-C-methyl-D-erythritol 4-phosphate cytidylyltransferase